MNIDEELGAAMRALEADGPDTSAIGATVRQRIAKRNRIRRTAVAGSIAAAVVLIVTTGPLLIAPSQSGIQTGSAPAATPLPSYGAPSGPGVPSTDAPQPSVPDETASASTTEPASTAGSETTVSGGSARCYATAELRADNYVPFSLGNKSGPEPAGPVALEVCRQMWVRGTLSGTEPFKRSASEASGNPTMPGLVACVIPAQISDENTREVAILPGTDSTCAELQLPVYVG